MISILFM